MAPHSLEKTPPRAFSLVEAGESRCWEVALHYEVKVPGQGPGTKNRAAFSRNTNSRAPPTCPGEGVGFDPGIDWLAGDQTLQLIGYVKQKPPADWANGAAAHWLS